MTDTERSPKRKNPPPKKTAGEKVVNYPSNRDYIGESSYLFIFVHISFISPRFSSISGEIRSFFLYLYQTLVQKTGQKAKFGA